MCFIPSITTSTGNKERALSLSISITDQEKEKFYFDLLTCYDLIFAKNMYLTSATLKKLDIIECKESITRREKSYKDGKVEIWELYHGREQLIKSAMSLLENLLIPEVCPERIAIFWQHCKLNGEVTAGKSSLGRRAMDYTYNTFKFCYKSHHC